MIKVHFNSIVKQLKNHSGSLKKSNIFIDRLWTIIDEDNEVQRIIFKKDKSLILSKNGQSIIGKWDYLLEARSILIDRNTDKILCNEAYIDDAVMILKLDGTDNQFFILANENVIPDLDVFKYLANIRSQKLNIMQKKLVDGQILEIQIQRGWEYPSIGDKVTIDLEEVTDGKYQLNKEDNFYEIERSKIIHILKAKVYTNHEDVEITIHQKNHDYISKGDNVFINNRITDIETINFSKNERLTIHNGRVVKLENISISFGRYLIEKFWS